MPPTALSSVRAQFPSSHCRDLLLLCLHEASSIFLLDKLSSRVVVLTTRIRHNQML